MIVERLGRYHRMRGPGWCGRIPLIERSVVVNPGEFVRNWNSHDEARLEKELTQEFYARGAPQFHPPRPTGDDEYPHGDAAARRAEQAAREAIKRARRPLPK
jgi:hypothetical protein